MLWHCVCLSADVIQISVNGFLTYGAELGQGFHHAFGPSAENSFFKIPSAFVGSYNPLFLRTSSNVWCWDGGGFSNLFFPFAVEIHKTGERYKSVGVQKYRWSTAGDNRVRPEHKALNGKIFDWDNPPLSTGGKHPGEDFGCRCIAIPIVE